MPKRILIRRTHHLATSFFLQMAVILCACRVVGWLASRIGQQQVVGEMIAGVLPGPSLIGYLFPKASARLLTEETSGILYIGSQLGVGLYMFLVDTEFRTELFRACARSAASVSVAGMATLIFEWVYGRHMPENPPTQAHQPHRLEDRSSDRIFFWWQPGCGFYPLEFTRSFHDLIFLKQ